MPEKTYNFLQDSCENAEKKLKFLEKTAKRFLEQQVIGTTND